MTRDNGRGDGQYTDAGTVEVNSYLISKKHLKIEGCRGSDFSHFYPES